MHSKQSEKRNSSFEKSEDDSAIESDLKISKRKSQESSDRSEVTSDRDTAQVEPSDKDSTDFVVPDVKVTRGTLGSDPEGNALVTNAVKVEELSPDNRVLEQSGTAADDNSRGPSPKADNRVETEEERAKDDVTNQPVTTKETRFETGSLEENQSKPFNKDSEECESDLVDAKVPEDGADAGSEWLAEAVEAELEELDSFLDDEETNTVCEHETVGAGAELVEDERAEKTTSSKDNETAGEPGEMTKVATAENCGCAVGEDVAQEATAEGPALLVEEEMKQESEERDGVPCGENEDSAGKPETTVNPGVEELEATGDENNSDSSCVPKSDTREVAGVEHSTEGPLSQESETSEQRQSVEIENNHSARSTDRLEKSSSQNGDNVESANLSNSKTETGVSLHVEGVEITNMNEKVEEESVEDAFDEIAPTESATEETTASALVGQSDAAAADVGSECQVGLHLCLHRVWNAPEKLQPPQHVDGLPG